MKITVEHTDTAENEVILRYPALDEEMLGVLSLLRSGLQRLCVWDDSRQTTLLAPDEVVHCETVDERVFVYTAQSMYQTALGLGELESRYGGLGFFRAGRSAVVNLHHIRSLSSRGAGRIALWAALANLIFIGCSLALRWFQGLPVWGGLLLVLFLEWALAAMWYALRLRDKRDTAALNQGLRRFQERS